MATRSKKPDPPGPPQLPAGQSLFLFRKQIDAGKKLLEQGTIDKAQFGQWHLVTKNVLEKAFGTNSPNVSNFEGVGRVMFYTPAMDDAWWARHNRETLDTLLPRLTGLAELIETELQLQTGKPAEVAAASQAALHRIFLVHGHNEAALNEVARFLEKLQQDIVVLREKPNQGRTVIEKFEEYADVGFAVVLLTGDDHGSAVADSERLRMRARQNVVFELGYFIGRLGRNQVCVVSTRGRTPVRLLRRLVPSARCTGQLEARSR